MFMLYKGHFLSIEHFENMESKIVKARWTLAYFAYLHRQKLIYVINALSESCYLLVGSFDDYA